MAISTEILNTTFADLRGPLVNSFVRSNELLQQLMDKARMPSEGGSLIERSFAGGAPAPLPAPSPPQTFTDVPASAADPPPPFP